MTVASFTKEVNPRLAKCLLEPNGRLPDLELTSLVKEATGAYLMPEHLQLPWLCRFVTSYEEYSRALYYDSDQMPPQSFHHNYPMAG